MSALPSSPPVEVREAWGMAGRALTSVVRPRTTAEIVQAFAMAREQRRRVCAWGNGRSYGDAALNDGELTLDMREMRQILSFDPHSGVVVAQPGLTLGELWHHTLPQGWWPPVVSGTMTTTLGGCAAANAHGKNNLEHGPFGEHILGFTLVTPQGEVREVTPESDPNLFYAAIGGFGAFGVFASITLQLKRVHSGRLEVQPESHPDLESMFRAFERFGDNRWDYVVGWIDAFAGGGALGRGNLHAARYVSRSEDPEGQGWLDPARQALPATILGFPKRWMWRLMKPFANRLGMSLVNLGRYLWSSRAAAQRRHLEPHARFNFLLDYVPDWKRVYQPHGLIQIQIFLPREAAQATVRRVLELQQAARYESWLVVMKRHRPDRFWLSHALDGFSFAMDFPVRPRRRADLLALARRIEDLVVQAGGRFYLAKDSVLGPESFRASLGDEVLGRFFALSRSIDPDRILSNNQARRLLDPLRDRVEPLPLKPGEVFRVGPAPEPQAALPSPAPGGSDDLPEPDMPEPSPVHDAASAELTESASLVPVPPAPLAPSPGPTPLRAAAPPAPGDPSAEAVASDPPDDEDPQVGPSGASG